MSIKLPKPFYEGRKSLEECIIERESIRSFMDKELDLGFVSQLLWAGQGMKAYKRTVPSAGAIYPLELYALIKGNGFYHYNVGNHSLDLKFEINIFEDLAAASWNQAFISQAPLNIIICANYSKIQFRYGHDRGIRYALIEVGHCAQNIHLQAVAFGLGSVPIGAFNDRVIKKLFFTYCFPYSPIASAFSGCLIKNTILSAKPS